MKCFTSLKINKKKGLPVGNISRRQPLYVKGVSPDPENHAQEKPDLEEQPERAPAGAPLLLPAMRLENEEICFSTFLLSHFLQTTLSASDTDETKVSKTVSQSLHRYS
jgi:hypothetical protein